MAIQMLVDKEVDHQAQLDLVNKYSKLRTSGDIDGILEIVSEDVTLDSAMTGSIKGKRAFKEYLAKQKAGESEPAEIKDGLAQCRGKAKLLFMPISFVARFQIMNDPTSNGQLIEKIVLSRT